MTKTIKFKLILDDYPVRTIEQLQEHFEIEDILKYFENELLLRWLHVRGYEKQYESVKRIDKSLEKKEIVKELMKIFEIDDLDDSDIEKIIELHLHLDKEKKVNTNYDRLITHMEENRESLSVLKRDAIVMEQKYLELFKSNNQDTYYRLLNTAPKAIYAILTRDALKKVWLDEKENIDIFNNMKSAIFKGAKAKKILGKDLKVVKQNTYAAWYPIEDSEKKLMVIYMAPSVYVRNAGTRGKIFTDIDVNNKLLVFNGLEYLCNYGYYELLYMEV